jgi:hypothetical protein
VIIFGYEAIVMLGDLNVVGKIKEENDCKLR